MTTDMDSTAAAPAERKRFGWFSGVFTPSILTILGVVMYLRLGWITGQGGLAVTLAIVVIAHLLSLATALSVASIATNRTVGAGGAFFMISRALGAPAGAAIGIPLYFAQALSITFYIVGFAESVQPLIPTELQGFITPAVIGTVVNVGITFLSYKSADLAIKAQFVVMAFIGISLVAFFGGSADTPPESIQWVNPEGASFALLFAVFFPAVTGIMAGVGMSGDLKDPRGDLPRGTLLAVAVGFVVYMAFPIWLSMNATSAELIGNMNIVFEISLWSGAIFMGVWGATLSSALGSVLTAPRTLQALAQDGLVPRKLGQGYGPSNEPRIALGATFALAQVGIMMGSLDAIAPILTMFFLATYGMTNIACGLQRWAASPSFRPTFEVHHMISLLGGVGCFYVMSVIDMGAMIGSTVVSGFIYWFMRRRSVDGGYGDSWHAIWSAFVRSALHKLKKTTYHAQNWRPNLLILGGDPNERPSLLNLGATLVQQRGLVTYVHVIEGDILENAARCHELRNSVATRLHDDYPNLFYRVEIVESMRRGAVSIAQSHGMGDLEPNGVMLAWPEDAEQFEGYGRMIQELTAMERSVFLVAAKPQLPIGPPERVDVWWSEGNGNQGLMVMAVSLLISHPRWRRAQVVVRAHARSADQEERLRKRIQEYKEAARLDGDIEICVGAEDRDQATIELSKGADLVLLSVNVPNKGRPSKRFYTRTNDVVSQLPATLLVAAANDLQLDDVLLELAEPEEPDEGDETVDMPRQSRPSPVPTAES